MQKIYQAVIVAFADPESRDRHMIQRGFDPVLSTPEDFTNYIQADLQQKARLIRISGAKAE